MDNELITLRRELHANPELSGQEYKTSAKIADFLSQYNPKHLIQNVGGTGVVAVFDSGIPGATVMFRSELDALPIQEVNEFYYRSSIDNVAHKCGHDGHSTILAGLAKRISKQSFPKGKVVLLFQPAEEIGAGAKAVLEDHSFAAIQPDFVFAFHNLPGYPLNQVVVRHGSFTAAVKSIVIRLFGKTAHAAEPEHGTNPALAIASILKETSILSNNQPERKDFAVITPVHIDMGDINYGISAGYGELRLTLRSWTEEQLNLISEKLQQIVRFAAKAHQLDAEMEWTHHFAANQNDAEAIEAVIQSARKNNLSVIERPFPFKWGEDFGLFTQKFRGAMFGIGSGENAPALHNPDYDFPDEVIPTAVNLFYAIASKILD